MRNEKLNVLIVDDAAIIVNRLRNILSEIKGVEYVGHAAHYEDALTMMESAKPDVMLLDLQLPQKNGVEILVTVKTNYPKLKVVMLTNFSDSQYRDLCFDSGCDYFLDKSTEFEKIEGVLVNIMRQLQTSVKID